MKAFQYFLLSIFFLTSIGLQAQQNEELFQPKNIKNAMLRAAKWQFENPRHDAFDWTNGAFYAGVFAAYETTRDMEILKALIAMGEDNDWRPGIRLHHADDHAIVQTYIDLYRILQDPQMLRPFRTTMREFQQYPYNSKEELYTMLNKAITNINKVRSNNYSASVERYDWRSIIQIYEDLLTEI